MLDIIFRGRCPIQEAILTHLSATEVSMLAAALRCQLAKEDRDRFQAPIRDLYEYQDWTKEMQRSGHRILFIGKDVRPFLSLLSVLPIKVYLLKWGSDGLCSSGFLSI